jgi:hypothetical protein
MNRESLTLMVMVLISSFLLKSPDRMTARIGGFSDATSTEISSILGLTVVDLSLPSITTTILTDTRVTVLKDGIAIEEDRSVQSFVSKIRRDCSWECGTERLEYTRLLAELNVGYSGPCGYFVKVLRTCPCEILLRSRKGPSNTKGGHCEH